jgi:hypothetical protein
MHCNRHKGPNIGSFDPFTGDLVPFFNPRIQSWSEHFKLVGATIFPLIAEARVTIKIFHLNDADRIRERQSLIDIGLYD